MSPPGGEGEGVRPPQAAQGRLLTSDEVGARYGVDGTTVRSWRRSGIGPDYVMITPGTVRYRPEDVDAHIDANTVHVGRETPAR